MDYIGIPVSPAAFWFRPEMIAALAALVSAAGAVIAVRRSSRKERSRLFLSTAPSDNTARFTFAVLNRGASAPAIIAQAAATNTTPSQGGGGPLAPPAPGEQSEFSIPLEIAKTGCFIEVTWTDQDGSKHKMMRWFQLAGDPEKDQRSDAMPQGKLLREVTLQRPFDRKPPRR